MPFEKRDLGSGPLEERYKQTMEEIAKSLDGFFNGSLKGEARHTGFVLLVFPFGDVKDGSRCNYISNGVNRNDIVKLLRGQANKFDTNTQ